MFELAADTKEAITISLIGLVLTALTSLSAWLLGYFEFPKKSGTQIPNSLPLAAVVGVFALFLGISLILVPGLFYGWYALIEGKSIDLDSFTATTTEEGWMNILTIVLTFLALIGYLLVIPKDWKATVLGTRFFQSLPDVLMDLRLGILSWFVSYPAVLCLSNLISAFLIHSYGKLEIDQIAVKELKSTSDQPLLLLAMVASIVLLVPFIEELLFRGFFQTWLKDKIGLFWAITLASAIFALFHFSTSQGILNAELIPALFGLSCFLGFLYERQRSLIAPIALHSIFNAISILMIFNT